MRTLLSKNLLGSTIALVFGVLVFLTGYVNPGELTDKPFIAGIMIILGALAYKSLKKRRMGLVKSSGKRVAFEAISLFVILLLIILRENPVDFIYNNPFPLGAALWVFISYGIIYKKDYKAK